jgi:hypothetical protein
MLACLLEWLLIAAAERPFSISSAAFAFFGGGNRLGYRDPSGMLGFFSL